VLVPLALRANREYGPAGAGRKVPGDEGLAIERSFQHPDRRIEWLLLGLPNCHQGDAVAAIALGLLKIIAAIDGLADRRFSLGIARP
jgi:hypothetical protein